MIFRKIFIIGFLVLSAGLRFFAHPPFEISGLIWIALTGYFLFHRQFDGWKLFTGSWVWGFLFFLPSLAWIRHITLPGWILLSAYLAVYPGCFSLIWKWVSSYARSALWWSISGAGLWVLSEWVRSYALTGFPYLYLSYASAEIPLFIQSAEITGHWGISFLIFLTNAGIFFGLRNIYQTKDPAKQPEYSHQYLTIGLITMLFLINIGFGLIRTSTLEWKTGPKAGIVQANIPLSVKHHPTSKYEVFQKHKRLARSIQSEADLIIWPETMYPFPVFIPPSQSLIPPKHFRSYIQSVPKDHIIGTPTFKKTTQGEKKRFNSLWLIEPHSTADERPDNQRSPSNVSRKSLARMFKARYSKYHLVPFGEYLPLARTFTFMDNLYRKIIPVDKFFSLTPGPPPGKEATIPWRSYRIAPSICYEMMFPDETRRQAQHGDFIINISNEAWYNNEAELDQMLNAARFRAIENRRGIIRATNTGISGFLTPKGTVQKLTGNQGEDRGIAGTMVHSIPISSRTTVYTLAGNWLPKLLLLLLVSSTIYLEYTDRENRN